MKSLYPFVVLENSKEEIEFYRDIFNGEIKVLSEKGDLYLQSELRIGSFIIHVADATVAGSSVKGDYVKIMANFESEDEIRRVYHALLDGGRVDIEMYATPFNALIGSVTDRNGVCWVLRYFRT